MVILAFFFTFKGVISHVFLSISSNISLPARVSPEFRILAEENARLKLVLSRSSQVMEENRLLRQAFNIKDREDIEVFYSSVLGFHPSSYRRIAFIDLGVSERAGKGMLAVNEQGFLLGKILKAYEGYSQLILLNDPYFSLPVRIENKVTGSLKGDLSGLLKVKYVEAKADVVRGDGVWVDYSGYPVYVGEVVRVNRSGDDFFLDIEVSPAANIFFVRRFFLIK